MSEKATYRVILNENRHDELSMTCDIRHVASNVAVTYSRHHPRCATASELLTTLIELPGDINALARIGPSWNGEDVEMSFCGDFTISVRKAR